MSEKAESGTVLAVCVSREKGTQKQNVGSAHFIEDFGIEGDAHAGKWHRQVTKYFFGNGNIFILNLDRSILRSFFLMIRSKRFGQKEQK